VILHDFPRHAFHWPLAWTITVPVTGDANALRANLDRLFEYTQDQLRKKNLLRLEREPEGLWSLNLGLAGPAVGIKNGWLMVSFSPAAVRKNFELIEPDKAPTGTPATSADSPR
jgi:hypothetical protein